MIIIMIIRLRPCQRAFPVWSTFCRQLLLQTMASNEMAATPATRRWLQKFKKIVEKSLKFVKANLPSHVNPANFIHRPFLFVSWQDWVVKWFFLVHIYYLWKSFVLCGREWYIGKWVPATILLLLESAFIEGSFGLTLCEGSLLEKISLACLFFPFRHILTLLPDIDLIIWTSFHPSCQLFLTLCSCNEDGWVEKLMYTQETLIFIFIFKTQEVISNTWYLNTFKQICSKAWLTWKLLGRCLTMMINYLNQLGVKEKISKVDYYLYTCQTSTSAIKASNWSAAAARTMKYDNFTSDRWPFVNCQRKL